MTGSRVNIISPKLRVFQTQSFLQVGSCPSKREYKQFRKVDQLEPGGRRRARRRNGIVSDRQAASVIVRAPPNSPNLMQEGGTTSRPSTVGRNEEEKHVCTLRCPASCQVFTLLVKSCTLSLHSCRAISDQQKLWSTKDLALALS